MSLKPHLFSGNFSRVAVLFLLIALFLVSLFANISHPLFWNDEGTTVVAGERILAYGYPKVHDGKNVLYDLNHPDRTIGIDEGSDAFVADANWAMYYVAAVGVKAASFVDDSYFKTAIIRFSFALLGFAGLFLLAWNVSLFFEERKSKLNFLIAFCIITLFSIPLVMHLREARYYSLLLFLFASVTYLFTSFHLRSTISYTKYCLLLIPSLWALFLSFPPVFFMFYVDVFLFLGVYYGYHIYKNFASGIKPAESIRQFLPDILKSALPYIITLILLIPVIRFFKLFEMADTLASYYNFNFQRYKENLTTVWDYLSVYDFLIPAIIIKLPVLLFSRRAIRNEHTALKFKLSFFLSIICIVHFFLIARIPTYIFIRYFIILNPILACIILLDISILYSVFKQSSIKVKKLIGIAGTLLILYFASRTITVNSASITGHCYEIMHPNKGCLDFAIEFIKAKYPHTDSLVISTNYEEPVLMYYLKSKVIIGYVKNNLEEDTLYQPDIIIYRKGWAWKGDENIFRNQLNKAQYDSVLFPVVDYPVNTIAEIETPSQGLGHLFRTKLTSDPQQQMKVYFLKK